MGAGMQLGEGERMEAMRRRRFWTVLGAIMVLGMLCGIAAGYVTAHEGVPIDQAWAVMPDGLAVAVVAAALVAFSLGCWAFVRAIDEVELADNLWASTVGYYVYAMLFPAWWALAQAGVTQGPNHWLIFTASLGAGLAYYFWRKWRAR